MVIVRRSRSLPFAQATQPSSRSFGPRGRPSIPGPVIGAVMVLQALECLSDREAIQRLRRDIAWKAATGLSLTHGGFHPTVLTLWRARLRASDKPERIFDAVRQVVTESGVLTTRDRRALDSTILHDAVATQDTVTMIASQIRRCRRLIPQAADLVLGCSSPVLILCTGN